VISPLVESWYDYYSEIMQPVSEYGGYQEVEFEVQYDDDFWEWDDRYWLAAYKFEED